MFIIFIGAIIFNIKLKLSVRYYFSDITIILSPILIISLSISSTFYKYYLEKNGVHCVDKNKIIVAGKSNVIALDKTGTLTENEFDLYGYQFTMPEEYSNNIYNTEIEAKNVNKKYINIPRKSFNISRQSELNNNKSIFGSISNINLNFISSKAQNQLDKTKSQKKLPKLNYDDEQNTVLSHLETSSKVLNKIHQTFWKDFSLKKDDSYKEDFKYNVLIGNDVLFVQNKINLRNYVISNLEKGKKFTREEILSGFNIISSLGNTFNIALTLICPFSS